MTGSWTLRHIWLVNGVLCDIIALIILKLAKRSFVTLLLACRVSKHPEESLVWVIYCPGKPMAQPSTFHVNVTCRLSQSDRLRSCGSGTSPATFTKLLFPSPLFRAAMARRDDETAGKTTGQRIKPPNQGNSWFHFRVPIQWIDQHRKTSSGHQEGTKAKFSSSAKRTFEQLDGG